MGCTPRVDKASIDAVGGLTIETHGSECAYGIRAYDGATVTAGSTAITTEGSGSRGLYVTLASDVTLGAKSSVTTKGESAHGVHVASDAEVSVGAGSIIQTTGIGSRGVYSYGGTFSVENLAISTEGDNADGVYVAYAVDQTDPDITYNGHVTLTDSKITTTGKKAYGVYITGSGAEFKMSEGTITTSGEDAVGVYAGQSSALSLDGVTVETAHTSVGVFATSDSDVTLKNSSISAGGHGVNVNSGDIYIENSTIVTQGGAGYGALVSMNGGAATINGAVLTAVGGFAIYSKGESGKIATVLGEEAEYQITGTIAANDYSGIDLTLADGSLFLGKTSVTASDSSLYMAIKGGNSLWNVTGNSTLTSLALDGSVVNYLDTPTGTTITVGNLGSSTSDSGIFRMNTDIENEHADMLIVTGTAQGTYVLDVQNDGGQATTGLEFTDLVSVNAGQSALFTLDHEVELGGWLYELAPPTLTRLKATLWQTGLRTAAAHGTSVPPARRQTPVPELSTDLPAPTLWPTPKRTP